MIHVVRRALIGAVLTAGLPLDAAATEGALTLPAGPEDGIVLHLQSDLGTVDPSDLFAVYVGPAQACCAGRSKMAGRYTARGRTVTFDPAFDFAAGQDYTIQTFAGHAGIAAGLTDFAIAPALDRPSAEVRGIYPSGAVLPENTLRFHIHFSTPMKPHVSADFIQLVGATGTPDPAAFMAFKQELWSADRKRLTVLMDPGRIKRGVAQNIALGAALEAGKSYAIVVKNGWPSADGTEVAPRFVQSFRASDALRTIPSSSLWTFKPPHMMSREDLVITFDRPFDRQSASSKISVLDGAGRLLGGVVTLEDAETTWRFTPHQPWTTATVQIVVDARMEDVAGNNFRDVLDHAAGTDSHDIDHEIVTLTLTRAPD